MDALPMAAPSSTRLDKLIHLLQHARSPKLRLAAGDQIAALATNTKPLSVSLIRSLIKRLYPLLHCKDASTRVAITHTFDCLARLFTWDPPSCLSTCPSTPAWTDAPTSFRHLDLLLFLDLPPLLANNLVSSSPFPKSRIDSLSRLGLCQDDLVHYLPSEHHLSAPNKSNAPTTHTSASSPTLPAVKTDPSATPPPPNSAFITNALNQINDPNTSTRERNSMRRRLKRMGVRLPPIEPVAVHPTKKRRQSHLIHSNHESEEDDDLDDPEETTVPDANDNSDKLIIAFKKKPTPSEQDKPAPVDETETENLENRWPFQDLCDMLCIDILDPVWEVRQGAAMTLRDILKSHGSVAGKLGALANENNHTLNQAYLMHIATKMIEVLCRDNFADYKGDIVTVPVRETASQVLGAIAKHLDQGLVVDVLTCVLKLAQLETPSKSRSSSPQSKKTDDDDEHHHFNDWSMHLAAYLAIKYVLAIRQADMSETLLQIAFPVVVKGLAHSEDDVRAVSAETLGPISQTLVTVISQVQVSELVQHLAICLDFCDELSSSTVAVMDLLTSLVGHANVQVVLCPAENDTDTPVPLHTLVPRLYKLIRHPASTVRHAVVRTLRALVAVELTRPPAQHRFWIRQDLVRYVFQNYLLESTSMVVVDDSLLLWKDIVRYLVPIGALSIVLNSLLVAMLQLALTPIGRPLDVSLFLFPAEIVQRSVDQGGMDRAMVLQELQIVSVENVVHGRLQAVRALGYALGYWQGDPGIEAVRELHAYMKNPWAWQRQMAALVVAEYAYAHRSAQAHPQLVALNLDLLIKELSDVLIGTAVKQEPGSSEQYMEIRPTLNQLYLECVVSARENGQGPIPAMDAFNPLSVAAPLASNSHGLQTLLNEYVSLDALLQARVRAGGAIALVALHKVPHKVTPVVKALTQVLKLDDNMEFQKIAANAIGDLAVLCDGKPVVDKLVVNLSVLLCSDPDTTPLVSQWVGVDGILTLVKESSDEAATKQAASRHPASQRSLSVNTGSSGALTSPTFPPGRKRKLETVKLEAGSSSAAAAKIDPAIAAAMATSVTPAAFNANRITHRGAELAIHALSQKFGADLIHKIPKIMAIVSSAVLSTPLNPISVEQTQSIVDAIQLFISLVPALHASLFPQIKTFTVDSVMDWLDFPSPVVRYMVSLAVSVVSSTMTSSLMPCVIACVLPKLQSGSVDVRRGAIECIYHITLRLGVNLLPYVIFLVVPIIGIMSDYDVEIRRLASKVFGLMIQLVPLEEGYDDPVDFPVELSKQKVHQRRFLSQLLGSEKPDTFKIPVDIRAELRPYQYDGVNWMMFLNKYQLHGALCDDMGLGKTLQTITVISSHHALHQSDRPSMVVCPLTLVGHWMDEIIKYSPNLHPILFSGPPPERRRILTKIKSSLPASSVVITSYETVRSDYELLAAIQFEYCCLDEGHVIRNPRTKLTMAVKTIQSRFRLLLSGTPIQNNVTELWSLFDFLMPGFLGTEQQFNGRYGKFIRGSRDTTKEADTEAGEKALKELHRQVLPFILRRMKEDVLDDLPPKIIQDHYCEMSPLQTKFYREIVQNTDPSTKIHVFQALRALRNICNHPVLYIEAMRATENRRALQSSVADGMDNDTGDNTSSGGSKPSSAVSYDPTDPVLRALQNAPKLLALKQLLEDSGIGLSHTGHASTGADGSSSLLSRAGYNPTRSSSSAPMTNQDEVRFIMDDAKSDGQHRVLIFAQLKSMLDIIELDLFRANMPSVSYLRLDGSVDPRNRQVIVNKFNDDPSIDVLLLTTGAGGLGLNLTGADTVIFVDHDWNPMRDLQAMDRAHRLGQKRVVNVYRLITRGTIEEKIMGLQRFKLHIAGQVVNQQNTTMESMDTDQLLDLFNVTSTGPQDPAADSLDAPYIADHSSATAHAIMSGLDELVQGGYEDEDNMSGFLASI